MSKPENAKRKPPTEDEPPPYTSEPAAAPNPVASPLTEPLEQAAATLSRCLSTIDQNRAALGEASRMHDSGSDTTMPADFYVKRLRGELADPYEQIQQLLELLRPLEGTTSADAHVRFAQVGRFVHDFAAKMQRSMEAQVHGPWSTHDTPQGERIDEFCLWGEHERVWPRRAWRKSVVVPMLGKGDLKSLFASADDMTRAAMINVPDSKIMKGVDYFLYAAHVGPKPAESCVVM